ncbi:MAG TPA: GIY-YIG nuclease family protein, partial [Chitinophagaceae bacterium]|nr:GIY-YIG nuclease family protein [Chitinophagaceae bacterium]
NFNKKFFVYILQSLKDFSFYVGQCDDLDYRMSKHMDGQSKYTSSKRPLRLVYFNHLIVILISNLRPLNKNVSVL